MKYLKLFENWLNEADANFDMIKAFVDRFQKNGFFTSVHDGYLECSTNPDAYKISPDVTYSMTLQVLDKKNPSNKRLEGGVTFNSEIRHKNFFLDGRWTLNPIELLTIDNTVLQEAMAVKQLINSKFGEYLNKYGWLSIGDGRNAYFNGKFGSYHTDSAKEAKWSTKDMKANFTPEEIKMMKKHPFEARGVLEKILKEVESTGKNLFKFELGVSGVLDPGYKLCSSATKDVYNAWRAGAHEILTTKDLADNIEDFKWGLKNNYSDTYKSIYDLNSRGPRDAGLNNILYMAIGYAIAKATLIEVLYSQKTKLALALAGIYGNSDNKYKPELLAKWDKVSGNLMANLGVQPTEINLYAPNSPMRAPQDLESPGSVDIEDDSMSDEE